MLDTRPGNSLRMIVERGALAEGKLVPLPEPSAYAGDKCYLATSARLRDGLAQAIAAYKDSPDPHRKRVHELWTQE
jgi:hypothetical protein